MDREKALKDIHGQIRQCTQCPLHVGRAKTVPGSGPVDALIMFIGEAPGFHEDQQGLPFVGAAGRLLSELLDQVGIDRRRVFITNVVKCRPPGNRPDEKVSIVHGQPRKIGDQTYFPMYHPAAALHQPSLRGVLEADFERLKDLLDGKLEPEVYNPPPEADQLSLF